MSMFPLSANKSRYAHTRADIPMLKSMGNTYNGDLPVMAIVTIIVTISAMTIIKFTNATYIRFVVQPHWVKKYSMTMRPVVLKS
jgi:hypothetical protein